MNVGSKVYQKVWRTTRHRTYELPKEHVIRSAWQNGPMGNAISQNWERVASTVNPVGRNLWNDTMEWVNYD